jgi:hypothetical protein
MNINICILDLTQTLSIPATEFGFVLPEARNLKKIYSVCTGSRNLMYAVSKFSLELSETLERIYLF